MSHIIRFPETRPANHTVTTNAPGRLESTNTNNPAPRAAAPIPAHTRHDSSIDALADRYRRITEAETGANIPRTFPNASLIRLPNETAPQWLRRVLYTLRRRNEPAAVSLTRYTAITGDSSLTDGREELIEDVAAGRRITFDNTDTDASQAARARAFEQGIEFTAERVYENLSNYQARRRAIKSQLDYLKSVTTKAHRAKAWQDKKFPDVEHHVLARDSRAAHWFSHIEIDNDVTPAAWHTFDEEANKALLGFLPYCEALAPALRVRYLGKHRALGVYWSHVNTIAVDVRDTRSFIHEYGHHLDLAVFGGYSLTKEFEPIMRAYWELLDLENMTPAQVNYYMTPTEIFARAFEYYQAPNIAHGSMIINHKRIDTKAPYAPFKNDDLGANVFDTFDRIFGTTTPTTEATTTTTAAAHRNTAATITSNDWENIPLF
ncbi:hypothetical protein H8R18_00690 [Nanchangia anserum]|uniref:Uncharacterized protein n=1 Tax=Nanchangia anserum TaxID=2692125 RepID=A0A8I0GCI7_9ACTO|nr:hypothetical protein [Nanchangia anserum]MBD3689761.1 hypothetical protein [Nanchangia anserum]QOX81932.1 hypothetical protein H8R18_00690 [Nanchangia anserum]